MENKTKVNLCQSCPKRRECKDVCEAVKAYITEDEDVFRNHMAVGEYSLDRLAHTMPYDLADLSSPTIDYELLQCLTKRQREVAILYYNLYKTQEGIGQILGIKQQAVSGHIEAIRKKMVKQAFAEASVPPAQSTKKPSLDDYDGSTDNANFEYVQYLIDHQD